MNKNVVRRNILREQYKKRIRAQKNVYQVKKDIKILESKIKLVDKRLLKNTFITAFFTTVIATCIFLQGVMIYLLITSSFKSSVISAILGCITTSLGASILGLYGIYLERKERKTLNRKKIRLENDLLQEKKAIKRPTCKEVTKEEKVALDFSDIREKLNSIGSLLQKYRLFQNSQSSVLQMDTQVSDIVTEENIRKENNPAKLCRNKK